MKRRIPPVLISTLLTLYCGIPGVGSARGKDREPTPEEVVARHLESIGSAEALSAVSSRTVKGIVAVKRPTSVIPSILPEPEKRTGPSNFLFVSSGRNMAMAMQFFDREYPDDHFAFDGKDVGISATLILMGPSPINVANEPSGIRGGPSPMVAMFSFDSRMSLLGNSLAQRSGIMREGLLGGALSTAWPLLDAGTRKFKLKYKRTDKDGIKLHQLVYKPQNRRYLDGVEITLYFDFETFRHVMSKYRFTRSGQGYLVLEKFGNFKDAGGVILPHSYSIEFSPWYTLWVSEMTQILHNVPIDPELFHVK